MSKVKELYRTYAMNVAMLVRSSLKDAFDIKQTNYTYDGLKMLITEETPEGTMYFEVIIRPQPYLDPSRENLDKS